MFQYQLCWNVHLSLQLQLLTVTLLLVASMTFVRRNRKRTYSGKDPFVIALLSVSSIKRKEKGEPGKEACQLLVILAAQVLIIGLCVGQMMA